MTALRDFGIFLITIGILAYLLSSGINLSFFGQPLALPIILIIIGVLSVAAAMLRSDLFKTITGMISFVLIILWFFNAGLFNIPFVYFAGIDYSQSINDSSFTSLDLSCGACGFSLNQGEAGGRINLAGKVAALPELNISDVLKGSFNAANINITLNDSFSNLSLHTGAGSIDISQINVTNLNLDAGAGSINVLANSDNKRIDIDTGAGSILIRSLTDNYQVIYRVGLGSVNTPGISCSFCSGTYNSTGFGPGAIIIYANAGAGSISIES